jgi:hypothetical protein
MRNYIGPGLVSAAIIFSGFGFWAHAQGQPPNGPRVVPSPQVAPPFGQENKNPTVISGGDVGFRVDRWEGNTPIGRWVVRSDGKWVEPKTIGGIRRLTSD